MAAIYLVRHGQASFGAVDYDQLSEKGCDQARILGAFWQNFASNTLCYSGSLSRHIQTFEYFQQGAGPCDTSIKIHAGFNEFDHVDILKNYHQQWHGFAHMIAQFASQPQANQKLQKNFSLALAQWISCKESGQYYELWSDFKERCVTALYEVISQYLESKQQEAFLAKHNDIVIFTSGGTISILIQHILGLSDQQTIAISQQLRNTSVSKLLFCENSLSVDYFNNYSHLTQSGEDWITFR
ncbi:MAG: histidine phosphatase family protein [Litorilituus sp.]|jgi:broad specificity phosphatase PhoE|nr:histidine phosphatase family protein [Litorilituus sp.]